MGRLQAAQVPVRLKLGLLLAGLLAIAVVTVAAVLLRVSSRAIEGQVLKRGEVFVRALAKTAKEGLLLDDELLLHSHLADLAREEGVVAAQIFDDRGVLRASTMLGAAQAARPAARKPHAVTRARLETDSASVPLSDISVERIDDRLHLGAPVTVRGLRVGDVRLVLAPQPAIDRAAAEIRRAVLGVMSLLVGIGVVVAFVAGRRFVRPIEALAAGVARAAVGDLTSEVTVTTRDEIGALTRGFNGMLRGLREREALQREKVQLTDAFRRYVSRDVADEVLRDPDARELGGQMRPVTVLFADIRNFTALAETMSPRDVVNILNKYFQIMADAIFAHGGTLDKFMGDCVMAVFGAPVAHPDHASRAVWTAVEIQRQVDEENARRLAWGRYRPVTIGIGIASGEAVVGNVGARDRMEYTAIGDCVNTAARLQALAPGGEILMTAAVETMVGHEVDATRLTPVRLRGKEEVVEVYRIDGPRGRRPATADRRARVAATPLAGPMVEAVEIVADLARGRA
jgi:class 3 adenylate cyclase